MSFFASIVFLENGRSEDIRAEKGGVSGANNRERGSYVVSFELRRVLYIILLAAGKEYMMNI